MVKNIGATSLRTFVAVSLLVLMAACNRGGEVEEFVVVDNGPVSAEPVFTGKYN